MWWHFTKYRHSPTDTVSSDAVSDFNNFIRSKQIEIIKCLKSVQKVFLWDSKHCETKVAEEYCCDKTCWRGVWCGVACCHAVASEVTMCWSLDFSCSLFYIRIWLTVCTQFQLVPDVPECNYCVTL
jgi:hypothetical protein